MKIKILVLFIVSIQLAFSQSKTEYLKNNRFDLLNSNFEFPQSNFKIIGFGAYHGSQETEKAENILLENLINKNKVKYYLPETDLGIAYYFNQYLKSGDTILLKDLVRHYGVRVPQEKSIETYNKWKGIKKINDKKRKRKMKEEKEKELVKAIGLSDSASDQEIIDKVNDINLKAQKVDNLEQERENERNAAIDSEVENAIKCGKITEDKKEHFISLGKKLGLKELQETISCIKNSIRPSDVIHNEDVEKSTEKKLSDLSNEDKIKLRKENKNEYIKLYKNEYGVNPIIED